MKRSENLTLDYRAFLLRLWRVEGEDEWRALLENVETGEKVGFAGIQSLSRFIQSITECSGEKRYNQRHG